jgi:uncharacterized membrane protein YfcA
MWLDYLKFFSIGILDGIIAGLLGIGGGVVIIPILLYIAGVDAKSATAMSAIQVFFASSFGTVFNWLQKTINFRYALIFGLSSAVSYFLGSFFTHKIPDTVIKIIYLASVVLAMLIFFIRKNNNRSAEEYAQISKKIPERKDYFKIVPFALFAGFFFGVLGIGGGILYVPLLMLLFEFPIKIAIGTSLMVVLCNTVPGIVGKLLTIKIDIFITVTLSVGAIAGSKIGTYLNKRLKDIAIKIIFIILLVIIIARVSVDLYSSFK